MTTNTSVDNATHPIVNTTQLISDLVSDSLHQQITGTPSTPAMIWGQPGVGKSDVIRQVGKKTNRPVIDIRLLLKDPTDLGGLPYFSPVDNKMHYAQPSELPDPEGDFANAIILLDELSSAPAAVQAAALQLVLERRIGEYVLPKDVMIVAAGNRANDGTVHMSMPQPLRNRFRHYTLTVDSEAFLKWAAKSDLSVAVQGFIAGNPGDLNRFDSKNKHCYAYATPRSWEFVSREIQKLETLKKNGHPTKDSDLFRRVASLVGEDIRLKFKAHYEDSQSLPDPVKVVYGEIKEFNIKKTALKYGCTLNIVYSLRDALRNEERKAEETGEEFTSKKYNQLVDNAFRFIVKNINEKDIVVAALHMAIDKEYGIDIHEADIIDELSDSEEYDNFLTAI